MIANIYKSGLKLFSRSQLPNSDGYRFIGVDFEGNRYRCEVIKNADGVHTVDGMDFKLMVGWMEK